MVGSGVSSVAGPVLAEVFAVSGVGAGVSVSVGVSVGVGAGVATKGVGVAKTVMVSVISTGFQGKKRKT